MAATQSDRDTFVANVRKSRLIAEDKLEQALAELARARQAAALARALVERKLLTRFQAEMLLAGRANGFVLGQYRIVDQVGRGGMGRVFKAVHQSMNRVVAIKVVSAKQIKSGKSQKMFEREIRAAAKLMHPNIVNAFDANHLGNRHYLVMEFVDGPNLEQLVREHGPLPIGQACDFIRQAAVGLQYAHERGMVHRDMKPANLLVQRIDDRSNQCIVKILDFGLARLHEPDAEGGPGTIVAAQHTLMGTPDYVSPEQARDVHDVDIRSDLYSLGCTLYFLLTGQVPFPGGTPLDKLLRHATQQPQPMDELRPDVPRPLADIVRRLMAKDRMERFQTPGELAAALLPLCDEGPASWKGVRMVASPPGSASDILGDSAPRADDEFFLFDTLTTEDTPQSVIPIIATSRFPIGSWRRTPIVLAVILGTLMIAATAWVLVRQLR